jgi:hypothetical protein
LRRRVLRRVYFASRFAQRQQLRAQLERAPQREHAYFQQRAQSAPEQGPSCGA